MLAEAAALGGHRGRGARPPDRSSSSQRSARGCRNRSPRSPARIPRRRRANYLFVRAGALCARRSAAHLLEGEILIRDCTGTPGSTDARSASPSARAPRTSGSSPPGRSSHARADRVLRRRRRCLARSRSGSSPRRPASPRRCSRSGWATASSPCRSTATTRPKSTDARASAHISSRT